MSFSGNVFLQLYQETVVEHGWGQKGGPWEFNLRDLFRWCDLMIEKQVSSTISISVSCYF